MMNYFFLTVLLLFLVYSNFSIITILDQARLQQQQEEIENNANSNSFSSTANTTSKDSGNTDNEIFNETKLQQYMLDERRRLLNASTIMDLGQHKFAPMPSQFFHDFFQDILFLKSWKEIQEANETTRLEYFRNYTDGTSSDVVHSVGVCDAIHVFKATNSTKKHILIAGINENWGAFSTPVPNRTVDWGEWTEHFYSEGCTMDDLWQYLNHTNLGAIFTTTHQWLNHPKIFSIPLGVKQNILHVIEDNLDSPLPNKTELLFLSLSSSSTRIPITNRIIQNFNGTIKNKFKDGSHYFGEMNKAKFVLCPSGMGWDTYRAWESLMMGSIPILETYSRVDGFYKTFDELPVLWVEHYDNVTPALLEREYPKILAKAYQYNFEKLTNKWWVDFIQKFRR
ncbi:hypothetical protein CTEN210_16063 [Chaetoceros tenuissimus]|uniref:RXYLT1 C-terminal domain-containing protein n=1 Tax=Chaetoceros tenuissimus TaxID=426638 RepID=A0AAD3D8W8_9STRA|nr:hypothetical protein CTEN210_16063 [Chaetoceros tenuissimus]